MNATIIPTEAEAADAATSPFDYIIVGSGAGGGPLACRLAEGGKRVLLVEAGRDPKVELLENARAKLADPNAAGNTPRYDPPEDALAMTEAPLLHGPSTEDEGLSWQFSVRHYDDNARQAQDQKYEPRRDPSNPLHDPTLPGSPLQGSRGKGGIFYPRSSGLGGCTAHHAMLVIRPNDHDWDEISRLTQDESWSAREMQPYFAKMENNLYIDEYRGALAKLLGWIFKLILAIKGFINPKSVLDEGGHGRNGWQPTTLISIPLVTRLIKLDKELTQVLIRSAFKVIEDSGKLTAILKQLLITLGFTRVLDFNDQSTRAAYQKKDGVFLIPLGIANETVRDENGKSMKGKRCGVREFILKTQQAHPDKLVIASGVLVHELIFDPADPKRVIGVEGVRGNYLYRAHPWHNTGEHGSQEVVRFHCKKACGEVILSGGSFNTPQLLMLNGIGDFDHLDEINSITAPEHQITKRVNLPGVGRNLQDRYEVTVVSEMKEDFKALDTVQFDPSKKDDKVLNEWRETKTGLYTVNGGTIAILQRSGTADGDRPGPDTFTFGVPAAFRGYSWGYSKEVFHPYLGAPIVQRNLWTWVSLKAYTRNNGGTVRLRSADPRDTPDICFNSFDAGVAATEADKDVQALAQAVESMRAINGVPGSPFRTELQPKQYLETKNRERMDKGLPPWTLADWIKNEAWGHHACGTCRIGSDKWQADTSNLKDKLAVLDSHFKVHGVKGLRVVDASVFPKIPGYFILAPIFMMSEKAADTILKECSDADYPNEVRTFENAAIKARREKAQVSELNLRPGDAPPVQPDRIEPAPNDQNDACVCQENAPPNTVGLAFSGGGVRSATFSLGVLQAIAEKNRLRQIDYLSAVSGGGFTASFLGRLFTRKRVTQNPDPCGRAQDIIADGNSGPLRWLRTQANYLFASGTDDWLTFLGVFFRSLFTVHLVIGTMLLAVFGALAGITHMGWFEKLVPALHWNFEKYKVVITLSSWWWVPLAVLGLVVIPMKLGYWLAPKRLSYRTHPPHPFAAWIVLIAAGSLALSQAGAGWAGGVLVVLAAAWAWQESARSDLSDNSVRDRRIEGPIVRNRLTRGLGEAIVIFVALVILVALDTLAVTVASRTTLTNMTGALLALAPFLKLLHSKAEAALPKDSASTPFTWKMKLFTIVLALGLLFFVDVVAHSLFTLGDNTWAWYCILVSLLFSLCIGRAFDFLNYTSLHAQYAARITRTFLGASNDQRTEGPGSMAADVQTANPEDDIAHYHYRPENSGGPLHLIGVTVNETIDHASQREIRDRKGLPMTIGSFGVSVGRRFFAQWTNNIEVPFWLRVRRWLEGLDMSDFTPPALKPIRNDADPNSFHPLARRDGKPAVVQGLSLGDWAGVSGAAFSTGTGRNTNPLMALFMGLLNVRLGFWWDSGIRATERAGRFPANVWRRIKELPGTIFRAQQLLFAEWRGRFSGPSLEFWNLSDGGHLDNTSCYELIRRRVPFIILTDATHDPDYDYTDLANLVRNVRVDFGVEIDLQDPTKVNLTGPAAAWVDLSKVGSRSQVGKNGTKHALIASIKYPDAPAGWLLIIKASLTDSLTLDVTQYARTHATFPQDSTADQIYDDEQWESYRKLGNIVALDVIND